MACRKWARNYLLLGRRRSGLLRYRLVRRRSLIHSRLLVEVAVVVVHGTAMSRLTSDPVITGKLQSTVSLRLGYVQGRLGSLGLVVLLRNHHCNCHRSMFSLISGNDQH